MTEEATTEMARYIWKIILNSGAIAMSWGIDPNTLRQIPNGLKFHVQGLKLKGYVEIVYDEGSDYFNVSFVRDGNPTENETVEDVAFDELANVIDRHVEYTGADYKNRLMEEYNISKS